jgi:hypothetical protein
MPTSREIVGYRGRPGNALFDMLVSRPIEIVVQCHIIQEYLLSEGHVNEHLVETALDGIAPVDSTFKRVNLERVRGELLNDHRKMKRGGEQASVP